ncbi:MAG: acetate--CoA ligase family protein, partial [Candidatus Eisenbacteria bacterium]|nr:acetate--CoA ligase family protein [Candidatus Eisenbacteria bacterium]
VAMPRDGHDIKYLFEPRSVAVVGASHNPDKIGYKILQNIVEGGYEGRILPVNPRGGEILGLPVYTSIRELDGEIDLVVTAVPAKFAPLAVKEAADIGAKFNLVITSGFSEVGNIAEERELTSYATERGMRIIGPNIFGMFSASAKLDANFGPGGISAGSVAIITQSGALGLAMIGKTAVENMGISAMVSVGNKADIEEADLLEYLMHHDLTKVILMYVEGVGDGDRLVDVLEEATRLKPVVVIKSGRSKRGAVAAASHTGSLAGSDDVFDAIMRQCGVLRAESIQEAFNLCKFLSTSSMPAGENVVIVTNGGGIGVLATDACEKYNIKLYDDNETLRDIFDSVTPDFGSTKNPVDLTGGATSPDFTGALNAALEHDEIDAVISLYCETAVFDADNLSQMIEETSESYRAAGKPVIYSVFGGSTTEEALATLTKKGVPVFGDVYETVACVGGLYRHWRNASSQPGGIDEEEIDETAIAGIVEAARADGRSFLLAEEGRDLMEAAGITMPETRVAKSLKEAVRFADEIGYPVVMKVVSRDILHKSDAGGVALDLENREEVMDAYEAILSNCRARVPHARIKGIQVSEMAPSGVELIVGARKDPAFGPTIMFGMGGIYVEVLKDVTFRAVPFSRAEAIGMMKDIRAYPLLLGVRGEERKDIESVLDTIIRLGTVIQRCDGISDIEVN